MNKITSLADFFERVKTDDRYKTVAVYAYKECSGVSTTYEYRLKWMNSWRNRVGAETCQEIVNYLNNCMDKIPIFKSGLISPNKINTFTEKSQIYQ